MAFEYFVTAQDQVYERVRAELRAGRKQSHWMWFIFPQLSGLGHSDMAARFAIAGVEEAREYAKHQIVGPRLRECVTFTNAHKNRRAHLIFGSPDDLKFRSCLTLFWLASEAPLFREGLDQFYDGELDPMTVQLIG
ncbi:MAG: DUF1810 domain-containing protein [Terricaulis sp.]